MKDNSKYYEKYPHIEKLLIDFLVDTYEHRISIETILNSPEWVESHRKTLRYAFYRLSYFFDKFIDEILKTLKIN